MGSYLRCILPCAWPVIVVILGVVWLNVLRTRMLYRGPLPSDGPVDGFASKADRVEFYDTTDARTREIWKAGWIFGIIAIAGTGVMWLVAKILFTA